jgi:helicase MOV-10
VVAVEAIRQILSVPGTRVLATAPSNFAADVIAERLARFGVTPDTMFRLNALTRQRDQQPVSLAAFSCVEEGRFDVPPISQLLQYRTIVSTCISSSLLFATGAPRGHFDYIFVDEAGYALEPEALVPILTIADASTRVVLSGDPKQLGPIIHSACASSFGFGKSFLERLMGMEAYSRSLENPLCVPQTHHSGSI